jgi:hypothetical protein
MKRSPSSSGLPFWRRLGRASDGLAWKALAGIMLTNGSLALVAPRWLARRLGVAPESQPATLYVLRMFGIRTVLMAADLCLDRERRQLALREGVLMHATDAMAALVAAAFGELPFRAGLTAGVISAVNTALCLASRRRRS